MEDDLKKVQEEEISTDTPSMIKVKQEEIEVAEPLEVQEEVYPTQDLIDNCEALGYRIEVVAGAFYNCEKTEMKKSEFKEIIKDFLGKKVE
ncbi:hypothetical protein UT300005_05710 [Clostridium sp. CTA-5]